MVYSLITQPASVLEGDPNSSDCILVRKTSCYFLPVSSPLWPVGCTVVHLMWSLHFKSYLIPSKHQESLNVTSEFKGSASPVVSFSKLGTWLQEQILKRMFNKNLIFLDHNYKGAIWIHFLITLTLLLIFSVCLNLVLPCCISCRNAFAHWVATWLMMKWQPWRRMRCLCLN